MCISEGVEKDRGEISVYERQHPFGPTTVGRFELVEELLPHWIALVVLVDADPAKHRVPHGLVEPGVLESRTHDSSRIPLHRLKHSVDVEHTETESAVDQGRRLRLVEALQCNLHRSCRLRHPLLGDDA